MYAKDKTFAETLFWQNILFCYAWWRIALDRIHAKIFLNALSLEAKQGGEKFFYLLLLFIYLFIYLFLMKFRCT